MDIKVDMCCSDTFFLHPLFVGHETQIVQDDEQTQFKLIAMCLMISEGHMNNLFIIKMMILVLVGWLYKPYSLPNKITIID